MENRSIVNRLRKPIGRFVMEHWGHSRQYVEDLEGRAYSQATALSNSSRNRTANTDLREYSESEESSV